MGALSIGGLGGLGLKPRGGGGAPTLPAGSLVGLWYPGQYQSSPRKVIPNAASAVAVSTNLLGAPRRLFSNAAFWTSNSATITDANATASDGTTDAATVSLSTSGFLRATAVALTAGTYTLITKCKRSGASDQPFRMQVGTAGVNGLADVTATSSFQRLALTFTVSAGSYDIYAAFGNGASAGLILESVELFSGSSDPGDQPALAGHLYLGSSHFDARPSVSGGVLDLTTSAAFGIAQFASDITLSAYTVISIASKTATGSSYQGVLSKAQAYANFTAYHTANSGFPEMDHNGSSLFTQGAGLWDFLGRGYHTQVIRYSGTVADEWVDDCHFLSTSTTRAGVTAKDLFVGIVNGTSLSSGHKEAVICLYNRALSDAEVTQAVAALSANVAGNTGTITPPQRIFIGEGHSIPATVGSYVYKFGANASPIVYGADLAVGGSTLASMSARAAACDAQLKTGRTNLLSVEIGTNELYSYTGGSDAAAAANFLADLAVYLDARRAAGWKVVYCTILPRSDTGTIGSGGVAAHNARRAIVNAAIVSGWVGVHINGVADFAANATMGPDGASDNTTYYSADKIHPISAGHTILETIIRPVLNGL